MPMLDVFTGDAFSTTSLTAAINKLPHAPTRIKTLGLFREEGMTTTTAVVEEKAGQLTLIETSPRGGAGSTIGGEKRTARSFLAPHLQRESTIMADSIQNVRAFGSDNALEAVQNVVTQRLATLRRMHDVTLEYHRMGAIQGNILDADGASVIYNLFTEFGIAQQTYDLDFTGEVRNDCVAIQRLSEAELGADLVTGYRAFCGDTFFDALLASTAVKDSLKYQESALLRTDVRTGLEYGGIVWENYRGRVGAVDFVPTDEAFVVPLGTSLFVTYFAPADFMETVNSMGLPVYAKIAVDADLQRWAKVHTQSNPLNLCLRPRAVIRVTMAS